VVHFEQVAPAVRRHYVVHADGPQAEVPGQPTGVPQTAGLFHHGERQLDDPAPDTGCQNVPQKSEVLVGQPLRWPLLIKAPPYAMQLFAPFFIEALRFRSDR
jgi:hypothetical protein